jgi:hypothetical protein
LTSPTILPLYFDAWATCQIVCDGRRVGKFRDRGEAEVYLVKLETNPRHVPGQQASAELLTLAQESASALRLRGGKWKRKVIEEEDVIDEELNLEIPF